MKLYELNHECPKIYELNYCPECPFMERKWGDGPEICAHPNAPKPPDDPNRGNVDGIYTPPDWCPLREQPMLVKLVVLHDPETCNCEKCRTSRRGEPI